MILKLGNTRIKLEYSFLLIIAFSIILGNENLIYLLLFSVLHETGHLVLLLLFGGRPDEIVIAFYGIGLKHHAKLSYGKEIIFLLGGITVNAVFCAFHIHREINLPLLIINALPLYPLDGGRAAKLILNQIFSLSISDKIFKAVTVICITTLLAYSVCYKNISLIMISIYIIIYTFNNPFD